MSPDSPLIRIFLGNKNRILLSLLAILLLASHAWGGDARPWSYQPVLRPAIPRVSRGTPSHPIDAFLRARREPLGLQESPRAPALVLIRRLTFDLTGLPPTPENVADFLKDPRPDAYERLVDRLLASPGYGERWGRRWLDLVRYAQTHGYERDNEKPNAWRYRDGVIRALNSDKPYHRFLREQIAGDELPDGGSEGLIATGIYRIGPWDDEPEDAPRADAEERAEVLATLAEAMLGITLRCARCHDHPYDPLTRSDYQGMEAFLAGVRPTRVGKDNSIQVALPGGGQTLGVTEYPPTQKVAGTPRFPPALTLPGWESVPVILPTAGSRGRRHALARWITHPGNPLTARALVNRLWQGHFGQGLAPTPGDLGFGGTAPTHPELLDWLAAELIDSGWSLKQLHRLLVTSEAYCQTSQLTPDSQRLDPDNRLLSRQRLRRLDAEEIRDAILAVSGLLDRRVGGRGVLLPLPKHLLDSQTRPEGWTPSPPDMHNRRSVYLFIKRTLPIPLLDAYDFPRPDQPCSARVTTTTPTQALLLGFGPCLDEACHSLASRLLERTKTPRTILEEAFTMTLQRHPGPREWDIGSRIVTQGDRAEVLRLVRVLLNLNEFIYVD